MLMYRMLEETLEIKIVLMWMQIKYRLVGMTTNEDPNKMFHFVKISYRQQINFCKENLESFY